ncbi:hypothetical protein RN607_12535 [Demequina capsici]|nr:hypothetical protein [Demequina sp. PMTSA13]WNM27015.1 hypothetical protein RN607_12535 [Demequina sp. PMTSA13]
MPFENRLLLRIDVDPLDGELPLPPGLDRWPAPGEVLLSPAAMDLLDEDPAFRAYVPGTAVGTVGEAGLRGPDELVAYRGVRSDDQPRGGLAATDASNGAMDLDTAPPSAGQIAALTLLMAGLVGLPVVAFLVVAARLSAAARRSRWTVLRFLGAPEKLVRRINGVENVVLAAVGWVAALAVYPVVNTWSAGSHVLGTTWFAKDTALTPALAGISGIVVLTLAVLAGARTSLPVGATRAAARQHEGAPRRASWRLLPLATGIVSLGGQVLAGVAREPGSMPVKLDLVMSGAILVTAVGLIIALPELVRWTGVFVARRSTNLAARIGGARAAFEPRASSGLVIGLALLVMAVGVTIGQTRDARAVSEPAADYVPVSVSVSELPDGARAQLRKSVAAPVLVLVAGDGATGSTATIAVATCGSVEEMLRTITSAQRLDCEPGETLTPGGRIDAATAAVLDSSAFAALDLASLATGALPDEVASFLVEGGVSALITVDPQPVLDSVRYGPTTETDGSTLYSEDALMVLTVPRAEVTATLASIYRVAPYSQPSAVGLDPASGQNIAMIDGFIQLGLILATAMTALALATALADRSVGRLRPDHELLIMGMPLAMIRRAHRWEVASTLVSGTAVALVAGIFGGLAWQYAGGLVRTPDWSATAMLVAASTGAAALLTCTSSVGVPREIDSELLRTP